MCDEAMEVSNRDCTSPPWWRSTRYFIAVLAALGCFNMFAQRVNVSIALVCMVNHTAVSHQRQNLQGNQEFHSDPSQTKLPNGSWQNHSSLGYSIHSVDNTTSGDCRSTYLKDHDKEDGELAWDKETQGITLGALYWGYALLLIPSPRILLWAGSKKAAFIAVLIMSTMSLLGPVTARTNWWLFSITRFLSGLSSSIIFPSMYNIWDLWAPANERTLMLSIVSAGCYLANAVAYPTSAFLCRHGFAGGWPSIFYVFAIVGFAWCGVWSILFYDNPEHHPWMSVDEKQFLKMNTKPKPKTNLHGVPWLKLLTSMPVWAVVFGQLGLNWSSFLFLSVLPQYMREVLKMDIQSNGVFTMMPHIAMFVVISLWGLLCNAMIKRKLLSTIAIRRLSTIIGDAIPAALYIVVSYLDCRNRLAVILVLTAGIGISASNYQGFFCNPYDISHRFATAIFSLSNTIAVLTGILSPYLAAVLTKDGTSDQWQTIFLVTAGVGFFCMFLFLVFAIGHEMPWVRTWDSKSDFNLKIEASLNGNGNVPEEKDRPIMLTDNTHEPMISR